MAFKRLVLGIACLLLCLGWSVTAQSKQYSVSAASGAEMQIGGGLPLPIQVVLTPASRTGTVFPPLEIPKAPGPQTVSGTTTMSAQQSLVVPATILSRPGALLTKGQWGQNPTLYAVGTALQWQWPAAQATFNTTKRTGLKTTTFITPALTPAANIRYSNSLTNKFGGPAQFRITGVMGLGKFANSAVTIYGIAYQTGGAGNPPCTHTALTKAFPTKFPGPGNPACVAGMGQAIPTGTGPIGGPVNNLATTPGGTSSALGSTMVPNPTPPPTSFTNGPGPMYHGVGVGAFGPNGTVYAWYWTGGGMTSGTWPSSKPWPTNRGFTNGAISWGYPWTTGAITMSAPLAAGQPETFMITGKDMRTPKGSGTIQMVSGSLSNRNFSGPNANRGWVRLVLTRFNNVPALSPGMRVAAAVLMLLAFGYAVRRRFSA